MFKSDGRNYTIANLNLEKSHPNNYVAPTLHIKGTRGYFQIFCFLKLLSVSTCQCHLFVGAS